MGSTPVGKAAVFVDRDGVINSLVPNFDTGRMESPLSVEDLQVMEGAIPGLRRLQLAGYPLILVSNQPNYALGKCSLQMLDAIHNRLVTELSRGGVAFSRFCYCLHHPKGSTPGYGGLCLCRKPSPWFLLRARDDFGLSLSESWMIGDQPTDIQCGKTAGVRTIRIRTEENAADPATGPWADHVAPNLLKAASIILGQRAS